MATFCVKDKIGSSHRKSCQKPRCPCGRFPDHSYSKLIDVVKRRLTCFIGTLSVFTWRRIPVVGLYYSFAILLQLPDYLHGPWISCVSILTSAVIDKLKLLLKSHLEYYSNMHVDLDISNLLCEALAYQCQADLMYSESESV